MKPEAPALADLADADVASGNVRERAPYILIVTHVSPEPARAGNEVRLQRLIAWLRGAGYKVALLLQMARLSEARSAIEASVDALHVLGDESRASESLVFRVSRRASRLWLCGWQSVAAPAWNDPGEPRIVEALCPPELCRTAAALARHFRPVAVIGQYIGTSPCLETVDPGAVRILDTIDVFSRKTEQVVQHGIPDGFACTPQQERRCLLRADVVMSIQEDETRVLRRLVPERNVLTVGVDFDVAAEEYPITANQEVLFVGSDNAMNVRGLGDFCERAWPAVRADFPSAKLRVVGKVCDRMTGAPPGVILEGCVDNTRSFYRQAAVVINPVYAGTGLKIKSVEALCRGKCLVSWPVGVEGLDRAEPDAWLTCDSWDGMGQAVCRCLASPRLRAEMADRALSYARSHFTAERVYAPLRELLAAARTRGPRALRREWRRRQLGT